MTFNSTRIFSISATLLVAAGAALAQNAAEQPAAKPAKPAKPAAEAPVQRRPIEEPAVMAVLESNPSSPEDFVQAAATLAALGRAPLAKEQKYLEKALAAKLDPPGMSQLLDKVGTATLLRLARVEELNPEASQLCDAALDGAKAYREDPKRLAQLVGQLSNGDAAARRMATVTLLRAGQAAVGPLVQALPDEPRAALRPFLRGVLVQLGDYSVAPLIGVLHSNDRPRQADAIFVLRTLGGKAAVDGLAEFATLGAAPENLRAEALDAIAELTGRKPSRDDLRRMLQARVEQLLAHSRDISTDDQLPVTVWEWQDANRAFRVRSYDPPHAAAFNAHSASRALYEFDRSRTARRLALTALFTTYKFGQGVDRAIRIGPPSPFWDYSISDNPHVYLLDVLQYGMDQGHVLAATGAAEALRLVKGEPDLLASKAGEPSILARAAAHPDRRLRLAAVSTIVGLRPNAPFAGSSAVTDALAYFVGTSGHPKALVAHRRSAPGQQIVGLLATLKYETDVASSGRELFHLATRSPDYELAVIDTTIDHPPLLDLLISLRKDPRTATLPIALLSPVESLEHAQSIAEDVPLCEAIVQPTTPEAIQEQVRRTLATAGRGFVPHAERQRQAATALELILTLTETKNSPFDLQRLVPALQRAVHVPRFSAKATIVLRRIGGKELINDK